MCLKENNLKVIRDDTVVLRAIIREAHLVDDRQHTNVSGKGRDVISHDHFT